MNYLLTDEYGKDYKGREWNIGITHTESEPNYQFTTYGHAAVALFLNPAYDNYSHPRIWEVTGKLAPVENEFKAKKRALDYRQTWSELTAVGEVGLTPPTPEQRIAFGIICSLNFVTNVEFTKWALDWLAGRDRSKETAEKMAQELLAFLLTDETDSDVGTAHSCALSISDPNFAAFAAVRSWHSTTLDFKQLATVATALTPEEIGQMLES